MKNQNLTVMSHLVNQLIKNLDLHQSKKISKSNYDQWAAEFVFEGLRGQRYGQSFCNHFNIQDNILFYSSTVEEADRYIQRNYVR